MDRNEAQLIQESLRRAFVPNSKAIVVDCALFSAPPKSLYRPAHPNYFLGIKRPQLLGRWRVEWYRWEMSEWEKCRQEQVAGNVQWKQSSPQDIHLNIACLQYEKMAW